MAVVPYDAFDYFPGVIGKDYVDRVTASQIKVGEQSAEWLAKTINGKGTIVMFGGTPDNPITSAQADGWRPVFAKYPGIRVLEVPTNWDPALAQQKTAALIAQYPVIDGIYSETTGPIHAFLAAGRPVPAFVGQSLMELSCLAADHPNLKMASIDAYTWMVRLALRKAVAAAQGIDNTEPSLITLPFTEDNTSSDPKLAVKCDKSMPRDLIPSSMLTKEQQVMALSGEMAKPPGPSVERTPDLVPYKPPAAEPTVNVIKKCTSYADPAYDWAREHYIPGAENMPQGCMMWTMEIIAKTDTTIDEATINRGTCPAGAIINNFPAFTHSRMKRSMSRYIIVKDWRPNRCNPTEIEVVTDQGSFRFTWPD